MSDKELIINISNKCTTTPKREEHISYLLTYIYNKDIKIIQVLKNIKLQIEDNKSLLVVKGLINILLKTHRKEMYDYSAHINVKTYNNRK